MADPASDAAPDAAFALYREGLKKHRAKDYSGAVLCLEQAVATDATLADAWEALGVLCDKLGRVDDAIAATKKLVALKPDEIMAHTNLSRFFMKKGLKEQAEEEQGKARLLGWKQELASGGGHGDAALQQAAPPPSAEPAVPQLVSFLDGSAPAFTPPTAPDPAAAAAVLQKKIAQFEALIAHDANDALSRFTLGRAYLDAGRAADAAAMLEQVVALKPDYTAVYVTLGEAYEKAGKLARALKSWTHGIELAQQKGDLHPRNQMQAHLARLTSAPPSAMP
ncbi:MAG: tetratricopeptide repeat protein [Planctomycetes bacterium]|nr:tetratricopeptide repeat protein [Planctomycetota bacterium]